MDEKELAEHYDRTDLTDEIERASWEAEVQADPMVVTSLRLPKSLLDWIREQAANERVRPTALIRRWLEDRRAGSDEDVSVSDLASRVDRLESVTLRVARSTPTPDQGAEDGSDSMADLLKALQASVDAVRRSSAAEPGRSPAPEPDGDHRRGA